MYMPRLFLYDLLLRVMMASILVRNEDSPLHRVFPVAHACDPDEGRQLVLH